MEKRDPSLKEPYMDRAILNAGFSSAMRVLYALFAQGQKGGPLTKEEAETAMDQGEIAYYQALDREKERFQGKYPPFDL